MRTRIRITSVIVVVCIFWVGIIPCLGAGEVPSAVLKDSKKLTVNDPQFIPLSDEQVIAKPVKWYYIALGLGAVAGLAGGGGGGGSSGTSTGSVTIGW